MTTGIDYYITMVSKNNELVNLKGSSLIFSAHGWWGKEKNLSAQNPVRPSEGATEGGCGGNSAAPERIQKEASPAALLVQSRTPQKSFLFLFRRNWSRANPKSKEHFSLVSAEALRGGGGADSFVQFPLEKGSRKVYNYSTSSNLFGIKNMERFCGSQNRALIFAKTLSACGGSREIP